MSLPLVSIVIPSYNHSDYLAEAIDSVLAQDYPNVELIVLDDGSTDGSVEVLKCYDDAFHWETHSNIGQARTLNKGWKMARGDILSYLSADDVLEPGAVQTAVLALQAAPDAVAAYCDFRLIDPASNTIRCIKTPDFSYAEMLAEVSCPVGPGAFFWRSVYQQAGPWNPAYRQMPDYDFWLRLGLYGRFIRLPQILAGFRVHQGSQTYSQTTPERAEEPVRIVSGLLATEAGAQLEATLARRALASSHLVSAQLHMRAGRFAVASRHIGSAYRYLPSAVLSVRMLRRLFYAVFNRVAHRIMWCVRSLVPKRSL